MSKSKKNPYEWSVQRALGSVALFMTPRTAELIADALDVIEPEDTQAQDASTLLSMHLRNEAEEIKKA